MEIIPNYGRHRNIAKEDPDLIIVSDNLSSSSTGTATASLSSFGASTITTGAGIKYNGTNNSELRLPSVTFSPIPSLPPPSSASSSSSLPNSGYQIPEEIQVEPIFEYYQNGDDIDCSSSNEHYTSSSLPYPSGGMVITSNNEYSSHCCQQQLQHHPTTIHGAGGYHYQEPEENFISIDDIKAKPFLFNMLKKQDKVRTRNDLSIQMIRPTKVENQKDIDLVIIDDDDDDEDNENENCNDHETREVMNTKREMNTEDGDDDVILIEDDDDEVADENEGGEELDWMAYEEQEQDKQTYECFLCNKKVASNYNLRRHMMIHTGERPFGCDICLKRFREFSDLKKHRRVHCHEKEYKCMVCKINAPSITNPTKCEECDIEDRQSRATSSSNYGDMILGEVIPCIEGSDKKAYVCPICDRIFGSRHNLKRHFMIHTGEKPYKCDVCEKAFREVSTLKKHMLTHSRIKLFKCTQCGREYSDFGSYTRHKNLSHPNQLNFGLINGLTTASALASSSSSSFKDDNPFVITSVTSASGEYSALTSGSGSGSTGIINKRTLSSTSSYNNGGGSDLDEYLFQCGDCFKKFTNASIYKEHLKLHSRDFTFQCYICKKMFRTKEKLNAHFVTHDYDEDDNDDNSTTIIMNRDDTIIEQKPIRHE